MNSAGEPLEITDNGFKILLPKPWCFDCGYKEFRYRPPKRVPTFAFCVKKQAWLSYKNPVDFQAMVKELEADAH